MLQVEQHMAGNLPHLHLPFNLFHISDNLQRFLLLKVYKRYKTVELLGIRSIIKLALSQKP